MMSRREKVEAWLTVGTLAMLFAAAMGTRWFAPKIDAWENLKAQSAVQAQVVDLSQELSHGDGTLALAMPVRMELPLNVARFEKGATYNVVWFCLPEGVASLFEYMIRQAGGPENSQVLCREERLTVISVGDDGFIEVYDQREKDKLDSDGSKAKPTTWVANPRMMQSWTRITHPSERQAALR